MLGTGEFADWMLARQSVLQLTQKPFSACPRGTEVPGRDAKRRRLGRGSAGAVADRLEATLGSRRSRAGSTSAGEASTVGPALPTGANDMDFQPTIDRYSSAGPIHLQLRKLLEDEIASGRLRQGERLPSEPSLSAQYRISRTTVRLALSALEQEGLIRKEKGRGAFVTPAVPRSWLLQSVGGLFYDELTRNGITIASAVVKSAVEPLPDWAADSLQLRSRRQRCHPGEGQAPKRRGRHIRHELSSRDLCRSSGRNMGHSHCLPLWSTE